MRLEVLGHPACRTHDPGPHHPERPARYDAVLEGIQTLPSDALHIADAKPATEAAIARAHDSAHFDRIREACAAGTQIDPDTYAGPASWDAALHAAGAAVQAAVFARGGIPAFAIGRPPGHHATPTRAMGFCLFNNIAIAAEHLVRAHGDRIAIVDVDVHHGNGTQDAFYQRGDVLYVSTHQSPLYPGTGHAEEIGAGDGEGMNVNFPMPAGTGHDGFIEILENGIAPVVDAFGPKAILVSMGFDAHTRDPLGGCHLTARTYHAVIERLRAITPRVGCVLEGGYDLEALRRSSAAVGAALLGLECPVDESAPEGVAPWAEMGPRVREAHGGRWPIR